MLVKSIGGPGMSGVRVLMDDKPVGNTDATGKFTLPNLQPSTYTLGFKHGKELHTIIFECTIILNLFMLLVPFLSHHIVVHIWIFWNLSPFSEQCQFDDIQLVVSPTGPRSAPNARVGRWRVCGAVAPAGSRAVLLAPEQRGAGAGPARVAADGDKGEWCTYLAPGVYNAKVEVSEQEQRDGLQWVLCLLGHFCLAKILCESDFEMAVKHKICMDSPVLGLKGKMIPNSCKLVTQNVYLKIFESF